MIHALFCVAAVYGHRGVVATPLCGRPSGGFRIGDLPVLSF